MRSQWHRSSTGCLCQLVGGMFTKPISRLRDVAILWRVFAAMVGLRGFSTIAWPAGAGGKPAVSPAGRARGESCFAPSNPRAPDRRKFPSVRPLARRRKTRCALASRSSDRLRLKTLPIASRTARLHGQVVLNAIDVNLPKQNQK